eukprot:GFYU01010407.1.p1 GENE.GFYU01010407.1~~GFYU01010407.1.p1  ORF type:complete len:413 (-),score=135.27 GFYU01010407.1:216-1454(-)
MQPDRVYFFDTTLRDGEQSPGVNLNLEEKLEIARQLFRLGVDICEAGFPVASEGDFESVRQIAEAVAKMPVEERKFKDSMTVAALARAVEGDIKRAYDAVKYAPKHRIHTFLATSDIHLEHKLQITREQCIAKAVKAVAYAKSLCDDIEFSCEDAGRSERAFLTQVIGAVIEAGATTINIPDTVGYNTPEEYGELIKYLISNTPGGDTVIWSTHCHNDLGLATANTLSGVRNGARQTEVTINGIGERAGNSALEEVVMAIVTHERTFNVCSNINTVELLNTSRLVSELTGMTVQRNKAIVGANAFAHESGIHQDGMLKHQSTYEIMKPEDVGVNATSLVLGKHSGRHALKSRLAEIGYDQLTGDQVKEVFQHFKTVADRQKTVSDEDLHSLIAKVDIKEYNEKVRNAPQPVA